MNSPSNGHIPDYSSPTRIRISEKVCQMSGDYTISCNNGYLFLIYVVGKVSSVYWTKSRVLSLKDGDIYRIAIKTDPDTNFSGYTQEQVDAVVSSSGITMRCPGLPALVDDVNKIEQDFKELVGGTYSKTYVPEELFGLYWSGSGFGQATSAYNGFLIQLKEGWTYRISGVGIFSSVVSPDIPPASTQAHSVTFPFTATAQDKYLYVTMNTSGTYSLEVSETKDGLNALEEKVDAIDEEVGVYKTSNYTSSDYSGKCWDGSKFISATSAYNGILIPLTEGHTYKIGDATGVNSKLLLNSAPVAGQSSMVTGNAPSTLLAGAEDKYLFITVNTATFTSYSLPEEYGEILPKLNKLEEHFGNSLLNGKKALIFGDSITATNTIGNDGTLTPVKTNWPTYAMGELGMTFANYAQDGAHWEDADGLTTYQKVSNQISLAISKNESTDIVILNLGTNSWSVANDSLEEAIAVSSIDNLDKTKIHQAIRWALWTLRNAYPTARFFMFLPLQRALVFTKGAVFQSMEDVGTLYGCCIFDQFEEVGIVNCEEVLNGNGHYLADGLHPNTAGKKLQARYIVKKLLEYYIEP